MLLGLRLFDLGSPACAIPRKAHVDLHAADFDHDRNAFVPATDRLQGSHRSREDAWGSLSIDDSAARPVLVKKGNVFDVVGEKTFNIRSRALVPSILSDGNDRDNLRNLHDMKEDGG